MELMACLGEGEASQMRAERFWLSGDFCTIDTPVDGEVDVRGLGDGELEYLVTHLGGQLLEYALVFLGRRHDGHGVLQCHKEGCLSPSHASMLLCRGVS